MSETSHKQKTLSGINWSAIAMIAQTFLGLAVGAVLARLLDPSDFGLLAIVLIIIGFAELFASLGMRPAIARLPDVDDDVFKQANTLSFLMGTGLCVIIWFVAPLIADFFNEPKSTILIQVTTLGVWLTALTAASRGLLMRRFEFKWLSQIDMLAYVIGYAAVGITLALLGYGVWALVLAHVGSMVVTSLLIMVKEPPRYTLKLVPEQAGQLFKFGVGVSYNNLMAHIAGHIDNFLVGKFLGTAALGFYTRGFHLVTLPIYKVANILTSVMLPSYAELSGDDERFRDVFLRLVQAAGLLMIPMFASFAVSGEYIIIGMYGDKWGPAVLAFQILAMAGVFKTFSFIAGTVIQAKNRVHIEAITQSINTVLLGSAIFFLVQQGIETVAICLVASNLFIWAAQSWVAIRSINLPLLAYLGALKPGIVLAVFVAGAQFLLIQFGLDPISISHELGLICVIAVAGIVYLVGFICLPAWIIGPTPKWLLQQYAGKLPSPVRRLLV
ncbi:MAG: lipopolysaccharide biosynthesis protein [Pontibacterium sp.]